MEGRRWLKFVAGLMEWDEVQLGTELAFGLGWVDWVGGRWGKRVVVKEVVEI